MSYMLQKSIPHDKQLKWNLIRWTKIHKKVFPFCFLIVLPVPFGFYDCCLRSFVRQQVFQSDVKEEGKSLVSAKLATKNNISWNVFHLWNYCFASRLWVINKNVRTARQAGGTFTSFRANWKFIKYSISSQIHKIHRHLQSEMKKLSATLSTYYAITFRSIWQMSFVLLASNNSRLLSNKDARSRCWWWRKKESFRDVRPFVVWVKPFFRSLLANINNISFRISTHNNASSFVEIAEK